MGDDLLDSIIDGSNSRPVDPGKPMSTADALMAGVMASLRRTPTAPAPEPVDCDLLLRLDVTGWATIIRYLPAELLVPLLGGASMAVANRLVQALDRDSQAWLVSQHAAIERVTPAEHTAAARRMRTILDRLVRQGRIVLAEDLEVAVAPMVVPAPAPRPMSTPVQVTFAAAPLPSTTSPPTAVPSASEAGQAARRLEALVDGLAALVGAAHGRPAAQLQALAADLDHPALAHGLRLVAAGTDAHALAEALRRQEEDLLNEQHVACAAIREALLAIRFGEGPAAFRSRLEQR